MSKRQFLVFGVANHESIAWHIARRLISDGHLVHITHQQKFKSRVLQLLRESALQPAGVHRCDVTDEASVDAVFASIDGAIDGLVHCVAFTPYESFDRPIQANPAQDFQDALTISSWSLLHIAHRATGHLAHDAAIVALSYLGAQRVVPGYRLMGVAKAALESAVRELAAELGPAGIRVNAVSAGPIKTLAAMAIPDFDRMLEHYAKVAPMRRTVEGDDVAALTAFLLGEGARNITGQTLYVDAGYSILGTDAE